jgi:hypothetical protein
MKTIKPEKVDVHHYPFRGIYTEIAREEGVTRQAIQQAAEKGNPRILGRIAQKIEERKALLKKYSKAGSTRKPPQKVRRKPPNDSGNQNDP